MTTAPPAAPTPCHAAWRAPVLQHLVGAVAAGGAVPGCPAAARGRAGANHPDGGRIRAGTRRSARHIDGHPCAERHSHGRRGSLYIADTHNHRIHKATPDGTLTTVAGNGSTGFGGGDGGSATSARLNTPYGVALDSNACCTSVASEQNIQTKACPGQPPCR